MSGQGTANPLPKEARTLGGSGARVTEQEEVAWGHWLWEQAG